jgi:uncharacterized membrane protein
LRLAAVALAVTAATYVYDPASTIYFGILHCLAVSILICGAAFKKAGPVACAAWAALLIGLGAALRVLVKGVEINFVGLLPFGITSTSFYSFDYFPLFPWFGIFLAGSALGKSVYAFRRSLIPRRLPETFLNAAGRHSLLIYVVHQPVIMGILYVLGALK